MRTNNSKSRDKPSVHTDKIQNHEPALPYSQRKSGNARQPSRATARNPRAGRDRQSHRGILKNDRRAQGAWLSREERRELWPALHATEAKCWMLVCLPVGSLRSTQGAALVLSHCRCRGLRWRRGAASGPDRSASRLAHPARKTRFENRRGAFLQRPACLF